MNEMTLDKLSTIFGEKQSINIFKSIHQSKRNMSLYSVLSFSGVFGYGIGEQKIKLILDSIPDLFDRYKTSKKQLREDLLLVRGLQTKTVDLILNGMDEAIQLVNELHISCEVNKTATEDHVNEYILFSGFRNKKYDTILKDEYNCIVDKTFTKRITLLIVKDINQKSSKIERAKKENIPIHTLDWLINKYSKINV